MTYAPEPVDKFDHRKFLAQARERDELAPEIQTQVEVYNSTPKHVQEFIEDADKVDEQLTQMMEARGVRKEDALQARFDMPVVVQAMLKRAGKVAAARLLQLIESEDFDKLSIKSKLEVIKLAMDQAYGKADSSTQYAIASMKAAKDDRERVDGDMTNRNSLHDDLSKIEGWTPPERKYGKRATRDGASNTDVKAKDDKKRLARDEVNSMRPSNGDNVVDLYTKARDSVVPKLRDAVNG